MKICSNCKYFKKQKKTHYFICSNLKSKFFNIPFPHKKNREACNFYEVSYKNYKQIEGEIIYIRSHHIFNLLPEPHQERTIKILLFGRGLPVIKRTCLIALVKIIKAKIFFEFGTMVGETSLNIAMNLNPPAKVFTLDLDKESFKEAKQSKFDRSTSLKHFKYEDRMMAFVDTPYSDRITRLYGDSNKFDFSSFYKKINMIYIDGGHDYRTVKSDTENALKMLNPDSKACIAWDDYGDKRCEVTEYLENLSSKMPIFYIYDAGLCFYANFKIPIEE